jgi:hypothetical protein
VGYTRHHDQKEAPISEVARDFLYDDLAEINSVLLVPSANVRDTTHDLFSRGVDFQHLWWCLCRVQQYFEFTWLFKRYCTPCLVYNLD